MTKLPITHLFFALLFTINSFATDVDSISTDTTRYKELNELVVEGQTSFVTDNGMMFIPDKQAKNASNDAISLLQNMDIPVLLIDPMSKSVKNIANMDVSLFIDFHPATEQDIFGIRTKDVVRVEYYDNPTDPRFQGARAAVNFIMKKYEYGGYLKASAGQALLYNAGDYRLYSKINHKQMTYDISLGGKYSIDNGKGIESQKIYTLNNETLGNYPIERIETGNGKIEDNDLFASFRAMYSHQNRFISNEVGINRSNTPYSYFSGLVNISPSGNSQYTNNRSWQSVAPYFKGIYYFKFSERNSLNATINFSYYRNKSWQEYKSDNTAPIINNASEHAYKIDARINYWHDLGHNNKFLIDVWSVSNIFDNQYQGSFNENQSFRHSQNMLMSGYGHTFGKKAGIFSWVGFCITGNNVNGNKYTYLNPRIGGQFNYAVNSKNNLNLQFNFASSNVPFAFSNDVVIQLNEIEWRQGNNNLKGMPWYMVSLAYTWLPSNKFNLSASSYFECYTDKFMPIYNQEGDRMIVKYVNQGGWIRLQETLQATYRPIKEISMRGWCQYGNYFCYDGNYARVSKVMFGGSINGYWKNFNLSLFYRSKGVDLSTRSEKYINPHQYGLSLTYGDSKWWAMLSVKNIFNKRNYSNIIIDVPNYYSDETVFGDIDGKSITLAISYTFDFGRKIKHGDELQIQEGENSAIMKAY